MKTLRNAARRSLHAFARPARRDDGAASIVIEPYRGYGSRHEMYLMGRVFRQAGGAPARALTTGPQDAVQRRRKLSRPRQAALLADLRASLRRLLRRGARGEVVRARWGEVEQSVETDRDGYFRLHMTLRQSPPSDRLWHRVSLSVALPSGGETEASAEVFVPPQGARFVVISDIDDTVMRTGVASKARTFWRLFAQRAESRAAFPGVVALYRALHGPERNPMLYVSRGPWSIYPMLETFFRLHRIPIGPVLFLREWGLSFRRLIPRRAPEHKLELIRKMLGLYQEWPFVLIGDSGQHDPDSKAAATSRRAHWWNLERTIRVMKPAEADEEPYGSASSRAGTRRDERNRDGAFVTPNRR